MANAKIVGIVSSPRGEKSLSAKLVAAALSAAEKAGAQVKAIDIAKENIGYCQGCLACRRTGECPLSDGYKSVLQEVLSADGIILSSPNYLSHISAQLKTFLDRSVNVQHEQQLEGKYAFAVMASGGSDEVPLDYMTGFLTESGARITGSLSLLLNRPGAMDAAMAHAAELGGDLYEAIATRREYPEQAKEHEEWVRVNARTMKANEKTWPHNYAYWVSRGWL